MTINRKIEKLSEKKFVKKVYHLSKQFQKIQENFNKKIDLIAQEFIQQNCKYAVGNKITFKTPTNGFTFFRIEKIIPDINWEKSHVRFRAIGEFSGFEVESKKGSLWIDDLKPIQFDEKPKHYEAVSRNKEKAAVHKAADGRDGQQM